MEWEDQPADEALEAFGMENHRSELAKNNLGRSFRNGK